MGLVAAVACAVTAGAGAASALASTALPASAVRPAASSASLELAGLIRPAIAPVRPAGLPGGSPFLGYAVIRVSWRPSGQLDKCLDAPATTTANAVQVQIWQCIPTGSGPSGWAPQQTWSVYENAASLRYYLVNQKNGKCLDADLNTIGRDGTKVQTYTCNGWPNQQWHHAISFDSGVAGAILSDSPAAGAFDFLDADNRYGYRDGALVQLWHHVGGDNQAWWSTLSGIPT